MSTSQMRKVGHGESAQLAAELLLKDLILTPKLLTKIIICCLEKTQKTNQNTGQKSLNERGTTEEGTTAEVQLRKDLRVLEKETRG